MLARPKSEVIFNFMFEFINRAASMHDPIVANGLDELIPYGNWREKLREAERKNASGVGSDERITILINAFADSLAHIGNYKYVAETTILRPLRNRALYCLFYATRHPKGLEVYRDCQVKALNEQSRTRAVTKVKHSETVSGQGEIFSSLHEMGNEILSFLESEIVAARNTMLELTPFEPQSIRYGELWPQVLVRHVVRLTNLNKIGAQFWKEGLIRFPDWEKGKRVPQTDYRMQRPRN